MQLFSGDAPPADAMPVRAPAKSSQEDDDRLSHLENEVHELKKELADIQQQLTAFRKQFE
jgi:uncharacterized protein YceH (UPF0502 family)